ncbi:peptide ABC transporter substrate-binding protein [Oceanirhabdus sp. W0125-5]|uniref:peptide ABC transporter substrate-binding protein n=1 Tax=Oceanirhabdus sp. W0125-5 TaxID=2999116 RepID=UPI0022F2DBD8|nr:peptide ABC transporter substrate-binding protein [Oceanirhabdus sp. W0125-5]WBW99548.1 peptide ABC transporter substrate-binding protein [Oceanirhabdus sp. W0125-5]
MIKKGLALLLSMTLVVGAFVSCGNKEDNSNSANSSNSTQNESTDKNKDNDNDKDKDEDKNTTNNGDKDEEQDVAKDVPQEIVWNLGANPRHLDPGLNSATDGGDVGNNLFEGLVREFNGEYKPGIAKSWEVSDDGLVYTFHLRDSKWSDGTPLTANDFEYAWKRVLDPETASEYAFIMDPILNATEYNLGEGATADEVGVKAIDEKTLQVTLKSPTPYFLGLTAFYTYFPVNKKAVEAGEDGLWAKQPENFIGNGPFKLVEYVDSHRLVMVKNEHYWKADDVKLEKITAKMIVEDSTAYTAYQNGEIQVLNSVPNDLIPQLMVEDPEFYVLPVIGTYYYMFNMRDDSIPQLQDLRVRKAMAYAIDRKELVEQVLKGGQLPAPGFVPPGILDAEGNEFRTVAGDYGMPSDDSKLEEAKALLAEAGYPNGEGFPTLDLKYNTNESHKTMAEAVQAMWKKNLGINVELSNSEWAVFQEDRRNGRYDVARGGWLGDYSDPNTMLDLFIIDGSMNDSKWVNEEYTRLIQEAPFLNGQERMENFYKAEKILMEELPIVPVYFYTDFFMVKSNVIGVSKTKLNSLWLGDVIVEAE